MTWFCRLPLRLASFVLLTLGFFPSFPVLAQTTAACRLPGLSTEVQCGSIKRALEPTSAGATASTEIDIHFVVFPALARRSKAPPLFFLAGGPGQSAIDLAPKLEGLFNRLNQRRDIVFVDQRGTGKSAPLMCVQPPKQVTIAQSLRSENQIEQLAICKKRWAALPHGKLNAFTTTLAMQDLEAIRVKQGYGVIDLIGGSYGTRAALEYARLYPANVRRIVIDGVAPADMVLPVSGPQDFKASLQRILAMCSADEDCNKRYPNINLQWDELLKKMPITTEVKNAASQKKESVTFSNTHLTTMLRQPLYAPSFAAGLPFAIAQANAGQFGPLLGLATALSADSNAKLAWGMHFAVVCSEDYPKMAAVSEAQNAVQKDGEDSMTAMYRSVCKDWPVGKVDPDFYLVKPTQAAVLILSGGADPVTPPRHGERIAQALGSASKHVIAPNLGHGVMGQGCMPDLLFRFFNASTNEAALKIDAKCVESIPAPKFFVPFSNRVFAQ
jgi:pimeloyl-ACP methyl ester carboxylesterase